MALPADGPTLVVIGASWGGLNALTLIVGGLPDDFGVPLVVVQHRSKDADSLLADLLQDHTALRVSEVEDKEPIRGGHVYLAPPNYHLLVEGPHFSLTTDAPVRYSRPSIDVTFMSAADTCEGGVVGVVLTGANDDGALGLRRIVDRGGEGVVQTPESAEVATMPRAAIARVPEARVMPLADIAGHLARIGRRLPAPADRAARPTSSSRSGGAPSRPSGGPAGRASGRSAEPPREASR